MKFTALLLPVLVSAVPETLQSFKASLENSFGGGVFEIIMTGSIFVSSPLKRMRTNFNRIVMKTDTSGMTGGGGLPGIGGGGIPGGGFPGFPGGAPGGGDIPGRSNGDIEINGEGVELLRYDMGKNFSWATDGVKTICECSPLEGQMRPFFVDATATSPGLGSAGSEELIINGVAVQTDKWSSVLGDGAIGLSIDYNVEGNVLRQLQVSSAVNAGGLSIKSKDTTKFWDVEKVPDMDVEWSKPHPSCRCPSTNPPVIPVAKTYPATCTAQAGCKCVLASNQGQTIEFCKDIVTWPISDVLFAKSTDNLVKNAFDLFAIASPSDTCLADYKVFLCKFYFQICSVGGKLLAPPAFSTCLVDSVETNGYAEVSKLARGLPADGSAGGSGEGVASSAFTVAVSPLVGLAVAALLL